MSEPCCAMCSAIARVSSVSRLFAKAKYLPEAFVPTDWFCTMR